MLCQQIGFSISLRLLLGQFFFFFLSSGKFPYEATENGELNRKSRTVSSLKTRKTISERENFVGGGKVSFPRRSDFNRNESFSPSHSRGARLENVTSCANNKHDFLIGFLMRPTLFPFSFHSNRAVCKILIKPGVKVIFDWSLTIAQQREFRRPSWNSIESVKRHFPFKPVSARMLRGNFTVCLGWLQAAMQFRTRRPSSGYVVMEERKFR